MVNCFPVLRPVKVNSSTWLLSSRWSGERRIMDTNGLIVRRTRLPGTVDLIRAWVVVVVVTGLISPPCKMVGYPFLRPTASRVALVIDARLGLRRPLQRLPTAR